MTKRYRVYSDFLKEKYGEKVYRIPISLPLTCPNRDGEIGSGGCTFCADVGAGFESFEGCVPIKDQIDSNKEYIGKRFNAKKFIAYFQNYTNTYTAPENLREYLNEAIGEDIVEIAISTRPDAISDEYLQIIDEVRKKGVQVSIEMGLQTVNYHTLKRVNRGHSLAEFIDAVLRIKRYGFEVCAHMILNLPGDDMDDVIEGAKVLSALGVDGVKLHSLYIATGSIMAQEYEKGDMDMVGLEEYVKRVCEFLRYASKDMVIQRIIGRAPEENTLFCNWNTSWWKIKEMIEMYLEENDIRQGDKCDYLNGKALGKWK